MPVAQQVRRALLQRGLWRPASCPAAPEPASRGDELILSGAAIGEVFLNQLAGTCPPEWDAETVANMEATMEAAIGWAPRATTPGRFSLRRPLEELSDFKGMEEGVKANALAAVEKWNAAGDAGWDTEFGRDPRPCGPIKQGPSTATPVASARRRLARGHLGPARYRAPAGAGPGLRAHQGPVRLRHNPGGRFPAWATTASVNGVSIGMCLCLGYTLGRVFGHRGLLDRHCTPWVPATPTSSSPTGACK